jgi:putative ABC transport system permease protein
MFKNYLKTAWRNLTKNKTFSFINLIGLTIGITSFLLVALYVFDELTFDTFHKNTANIYRVIDDKKSADGKETKIAGAGYQVSAQAIAQLPQVKDAVRFVNVGRANVATSDNANVFYEDFIIGTPGVLTVFDFNLKYGNKNALIEPHSVIVTEETATKFFGTTNVVGKILKVDRDSIPYKITGVLKNFPSNSSISFDLLFSESSITSDPFKQFASADWNSDRFITYLLLHKKADPKKVEAALTKLVAAHQDKQSTDKTNIVLQSLKDMHFYSDDIEDGYNTKGNIAYIWIFSIIALFVLLIACINYMNLTTAKFISRTKEIAVRKIAGASRKNLIKQFFAETFLFTTIALIVAIILSKILLPAFNNFTHKQLTLGATTDYRIWFGMALVLIMVSLLSGVYPALFQSRLKPLLLLKSKGNNGNENISLRRILVVFQFVLSVIMIVATIVVYQQMKYVNTKDMGFDKNNLVVIDINSGIVRKNAEAIKNEFGKLPQVKDISVSSRVPGEWKNLPKVKVINENKNASQTKESYFIGADDQFLKTYQVALLQGNNFIPGNTADSTSVLLNETAARELGITQPAQQTINIPSVNFGSNYSPLDKPFIAHVTGIVKDFNFQSLHDPLAPIIIAYRNNPIHSIDYFTARVASDDISGTLKKMNAVLQSFDQAHLFEYHFLDNQWQLFYKADKIQETIFLIIASLAILIACLGLFGLTTFSAEQRTKEIGVRKVLGASVSSIVTLLSKDFLKLVLIAAVIAFPVAWWAMHQWLLSFAYRINISWWVFVIAGISALLIALFTISFQAIRAALANPAESLRTE